MRYLLTARESALKAAVRDLVGREGAGVSARTPEGLGPWLGEARPEGLSRVGETLVLEELVRRSPDAGPALAASGLFKGSRAGIRAAAALGAAEGELAPYLGALSCQGENAAPGLQAVCDIVSELEAVRLLVFRAAILADEGKEDPAAAEAAMERAEGLALRVRGLRGCAGKGGEHEARILVSEGDRSGDGERPEGGTRSPGLARRRKEEVR